MLLGGALLCSLNGCSSKHVSVAVPAVSVSSSRQAGTFSAEVAHVRSLPLYKQAEQACRQKQFPYAANLLQRLAAMPGLTAQERAFCQEQRAICLKDAGDLPVSAPGSMAPEPADADCGPRALFLVCQKLGVSTSVERLRQLAGTTDKGTSMAGLAKAAEAVGLKAEGMQVSREALAEIELPAIAWVNQNHYVALLSVQGEGEQATATIHDPNATEEQTLDREQLLRMSSGYLLLVHPR